MDSKRLKEAIRLAIDILAMRGPFTRRMVAEYVLEHTNDTYWSLTDRHNSDLGYIQIGVKTEMDQPLNSNAIKNYLPSLPLKYADVLADVPKFLCISEHGGRGSQHVLTINATLKQWKSNTGLIGHIAELTRARRDKGRKVCDLLEFVGVNSLSELLQLKVDA